MSKTSGYKLAKLWFDYAFENPECVCTNHAALYFWLIEKANRCGWPDKLSITNTENMHACGFRTYPPYKKSFDFLVENGFIEILTPSKNQYTPNIICLKYALSKNDKANSKAPLEHTPKQVKSNSESTFDINKTIQTNKPIQTLFNTDVKKQTRVGIEFFDLNPWDVYKKICGISYPALMAKVSQAKITEVDFETSFNEKYLGIEFTNKNHLLNSASKHLKDLMSYGTNTKYSGRSETGLESIGTGKPKNFGNSIGS